MFLCSAVCRFSLNCAEVTVGALVLELAGFSRTDFGLGLGFEILTAYWVQKVSNAVETRRVHVPMRRGSMCVTTPNFMVFGQTVSEILRVFDFQDGGHFAS